MRKNYSKFIALGVFVFILFIFFIITKLDNSSNKIDFLDPGLEYSVRDSIEKYEGDILPDDIQNLQILDASNRGIEDISGIEKLTELRELNLEDNFVKSVSPLKKLMKLEDLNLRNNEITNLKEVNFQDITSLSLKKLNLRHNVKRNTDGDGTRLEDLSLLSNMVSLKNLKLRDNHIEDLSPLSNLLKLKKLDIRENKVTTIEPLKPLVRLEELNIRENKIDSLQPLHSLKKLTYLNIHSIPTINSLEPIKDLVHLETLIMRNVEINDADFLKNLHQLQTLNAIDTGLENFDQVVIENLISSGVLKGQVRPIHILHTLDTPLFSHDTGFYKEKFLLDLAIVDKDENKKIYYTLDGSEPTLNSFLYSEPISIDEIDNHATIVRAKVLTEQNTMSETITKTYFTSNNIDTRFDLPIFSLVTDPENLFDEEKGIYTEQNAHNRGSDWERPVHFDYFEPNGTVTLTQNAGIRIHGGWTRGLPQKSFRLYAKSEYSPQSSFENVFFPTLKKNKTEEHVDSFKRLILRNSGNDNDQTMFNDGFMQELAEPIKTFDVQAYQPATIFFNGEYLGILNIRERLDEYYVESHYDMNRDDVVILENDAELYRGKNKDVYHYKEMLKYIEENNIQEDEHINHVETMMDFDNFIDLFATEIYYGNADWPQNNMKYWRKNTDGYMEDAPYGHDGRWRWMLNDTDFGFYRSDELWGHYQQPLNHEHNTIKIVMNEFDGRLGSETWPNFLFRELMSNQEFKNKFLGRFNDLANGYLNEQAATKKIDEKMNELNTEIDYHIERWGSIPSKEMWQSYIERKKIFAKERPSIIREFMMEEFEIENTILVHVNNETESGYIRLNSMDIMDDLPGNDGNPVWSGTYFKGIPISLEAIAKDGYQFSHWEGTDLKEPYIEFDSSDDIELNAVFIKK